MMADSNTEEKKQIETILFLENTPTPIKRISAITKFSREKVEELIKVINQNYQKINSNFIIRKIEESYQLTLDPKWHHTVVENYSLKKKKISKQVLLTLVIIAYKQPITKVEIDEIRGSNSANYLRQLLENQFIEFAGKKDVPGKPSMYRTSEKFLMQFGLESLKDLPTIKEIKSYDFLDEEDFLYQMESKKTGNELSED